MMKKSIEFFRKTKHIIKPTLFCITFTVVFILFSFTQPFFPVKTERFAYGIIGTIAAFLTTYLFLRPDKKSFADIGLKIEKTTLIKFVAGVVIGIGIMSFLAMGTIYFSGYKIVVNENSSLFHFLFMTLPLIPMAFMEELGFRAYPLIVLKETAGPRNSIIITSVLFALYHIANGWTIQNSFLGAGVWGIIFGLAAIYSNGISMSTGLHYAANVTTSAIGISNNSLTIWLVKQKNGLPSESVQGSQLPTFIPQITLLLFGLLALYWFLGKNNHH